MGEERPRKAPQSPAQLHFHNQKSLQIPSWSLSWMLKIHFRENENKCLEEMNPVSQTLTSEMGLKGLLYPRRLQLRRSSWWPKIFKQRMREWVSYRTGNVLAVHTYSSACKNDTLQSHLQLYLHIHPHHKYYAKYTKSNCPYTHQKEFQDCLLRKPLIKVQYLRVTNQNKSS